MALTKVTGGVGIVKDLHVGGNITVGGTLTYDDVTNIDSLGIITARTDIHLGQSLIHLGDPDTKINFDTNQIEFDTAGTERLRINSNGTIGINTTAETRQLEIYNSSHATAAIKGDVQSSLFFSDSADTNIGQISYMHSGSPNNYMYFRVNDNERLRIKSDGTIYAVTQNKRFGIGQDPDATTMGATSGTWQVPEVDGQTIGSELRLGDINTSSTAVIRLASYGSGDGGVGGGAIMFTNTRNGSASAHSDIAAIKGARESLGKGYLRFFTANSGANTERLRIMSGGAIGINTTTGTNSVNIGGAAGLGVKFHNFTTGNSSYITVESGDKLQSNVGGSGYYTWVTGGSEKVRITSTGQVGIGSFIPSSDVTLTVNRNVAAASGNATMQINNLYQGTANQSNESGAEIEFLFKNHNAAHNWWGGRILCSNTDNYNQYSHLEFHTASQGNAVERMRLNHDGDLTLYGKTNAELKLKCGTSTGNNIIAFLNNSGTTKGNIFYDSDNNFMVFKTNGTAASNERLRIDSSGRLFTGGSTQTLDTTAGALHISGGTSGGRLAFRGTTTSANASLAEIFAFWDTNKVAGMIAKSGTDTTNKDDGTLHFYTRPDTATGTVERLRIDSSGRVGINKFTHADTASALTIQNSASGSEHSILDIVCNDNETSRIYFSEDSNTGKGSIRYVYTGDENYMSFYTSGTGSSNERFRIENNGQLWLYASGGDNQLNSKRISATDSNGNYFFHLTAINNNNDNVGTLGFHRDTANDDARFIIRTKITGGSNIERLRIDSTGRIKLFPAGDTGNGTSGVPLYLQVQTNVTDVNTPTGGSDQTGMFRIEDRGGTSNRFHGIEFRNRNSGDVRILNRDRGASNYADLIFAVDDGGTFGAGGTIREYMRIKSEGVIEARTASGSYYPVASARDGSTSARAATSAWEIKKTLGPAARTGYYYLKDTTGTVAQWWCDMDTDGGGWILIAHVGDGAMSSQSTSGDHWWDATNRGGFNSIGSGYYKGGGYWRGSGGAWAENTCGQLMWDVRTHQEYYDNYANAKVVFNWGTDQAIPTGNSGYGNITNSASRRFNEWCYEVCGAPGFNPAQYNQNTRNNTINGGNHFTEHMVMTWCFRGTGGGGDDGDGGPYWMIGSHHDGLHQHYEEGLSGSDGVYGDGGYYVVSNEDSGWGGGGDGDGYPRIGRHTDTGTCNIWMR